MKKVKWMRSLPVHVSNTMLFYDRSRKIGNLKKGCSSIKNHNGRYGNAKYYLKLLFEAVVKNRYMYIGPQQKCVIAFKCATEQI